MLAAFLVAQVVAAAPAVEPPRVFLERRGFSEGYLFNNRAPTPEELAAIRRCRGEGMIQAQDPTSLMRPQDRADARPRRLGDLPRANLEYTVLHTEFGCVVPQIVRRDVGP